MFNNIRNFINDSEFKLTLFKDKVHLINYEEILSLDTNRISFQTDTGIVVIKGENIILNKLLDKEVLLKGKIASIEVFDE